MNGFLNSKIGLFFALLLIGATWGITVPLTKIAVSTGYQPFGLIFWELVFIILYLILISVFQVRFPKLTKDHLIVFTGIAFLGTLIPSAFTYFVIEKIPSGVYAITISLVPMFALPIAIFLKLEKLRWARVMGIILGMCAIIVIFAPSTSLPDPSKAIFVLLACIPALCYGFEDNFVGKFTLRGLTAVQALLGATVLGLITITPVALVSDQWISMNVTWGKAEWALLTMSLLHGFAYTGYVWLVGRAGPVFAAQVAYLVTSFGVFWSIILLGEQYSGWVWLALILMLAGLFLVQPKEADHS